MTHYVALIRKDTDRGYGVFFPDVPGVTTVAVTLDSALHEAGIALGFASEDWNGALPQPRVCNRQVRIVFSTTDGQKALSDSQSLVGAATLMQKVPYYNTLSGAAVVADAIAALKAGSQQVRTLQVYSVD